MIGVKLFGGLGNQLFQIAFIESLGKKHGEPVVYTNLLENIHHITTDYTRAPYAQEYFGVFENISWFKNQNKIYEITENKVIQFHYIEVPCISSVNYCGYFQSEKHFISNDFILNLVKPSSTIERALDNPKYNWMRYCNTCSIHVRRQDYVKLNYYHPVQNMDYYHKAMWTMAPFKIEKYFVFSDDIQWCKENFHGDEFVFVEEKDYIELFIQSRCNHHIISNSSFSWWAAWIGEQKKLLDSVVIAPKNWLGKVCSDDAKDIVPQRWVQL